MTSSTLALNLVGSNEVNDVVAYGVLHAKVSPDLLRMLTAPLVTVVG